MQKKGQGEKPCLRNVPGSEKKKSKQGKLIRLKHHECREKEDNFNMDRKEGTREHGVSQVSKKNTDPHSRSESSSIFFSQFRNLCMSIISPWVP